VAGRGREPSHRERWVAAKFSVRQSAEQSLKPYPPCLSFRFLSSDLARQCPFSETRANSHSSDFSLKSVDFQALQFYSGGQCGNSIIPDGNWLTRVSIEKRKMYGYPGVTRDSKPTSGMKWPLSQAAPFQRFNGFNVLTIY
jgi:hypothetical protein